MSSLQAQTRKIYGKTDVVLHEKMQMDLRARIATDLVTRWGMVAAIPDGEDSAGRQKLKLMSPKELVDRAMATAEMLVEAAKDRDMILMLPDLPADEKEED